MVAGLLISTMRTAAIVRFADHCVRRTEALVAEVGIDWDYAPSGNVMAVVHPRRCRSRGAKWAREFGSSTLRTSLQPSSIIEAWRCISRGAAMPA